MQNYTAPIVDTVVKATGLSQCHHLLDIGGATGNWTVGFLKVFPDAHATLFDRPEVIPMARQHLTEAGLLDRVTLVPGNYHTDSLPGGVDVAWLSAITHQHSREENRSLFTKIHQSLESDGVLLIRDIVLDESRCAPLAGALFAVNMLSATERGNSYTLSEYREDLTRSGFSAVNLIQADEGMNALIRALAEASLGASKRTARDPGRP
jgi:hypothetical protein